MRTFPMTRNKDLITANTVRGLHNSLRAGSLAFPVHGHQVRLAAGRLLVLDQPVELPLDLLRTNVAAQKLLEDVRPRRWALAEQRRGEGLHDQEVLADLRAG